MLEDKLKGGKVRLEGSVMFQGDDYCEESAAIKLCQAIGGAISAMQISQKQ